MKNVNNRFEVRTADRLNFVGEYYFSRKLKEVAEMNARGLDVVSLAIGSPDMPPSEATVEALCRNIRDINSHGYQPTAGIPQLRNAMAEYYKRTYGVELDPASEIQPLIGSKEGVLNITLAFVNQGEKVLVPNPGYPTYTSMTRLLGVEPLYYDLDARNGWQPDFEALEKMDLSGVRMMWTNYPNMPTGAPATPELYRKIVDFALRNNIIVVNDNPYSRILNPNPLSIFNTDGAKECCIELNSMSKSHNMPGWRVGMAVGRKEFIRPVLTVKSNSDSGTLRALQLAAAEAFLNDDSWHREMNIEVFSRRRDIALEIMDLLNCKVMPGQVGMFLWGKAPEGVEDAEEITERVLHEARVFITPGKIFGSNGKKYIRISLCAKEDKMREALKRIKNNLK